MGPLILELRPLELTIHEADELADKLAALGWVHHEIAEDERKQRADEADIKARTRGGR